MKHNKRLLNSGFSMMLITMAMAACSIQVHAADAPGAPSSVSGKGSKMVIKITEKNGKVTYVDQMAEHIPPGRRTIIESYGEVADPVASTSKYGVITPTKEAAPTLPNNAQITISNAEIKKKNDEELLKIDKENCLILKDNLKGLSMGKVAVLNSKRESIFLTDEKIAQEKIKTQELIKMTCK